MIYFVRAGDTDAVKIGWTENAAGLARRLANLQVAHYLPLSVIRTIEAERWVEGWLHGFFSGVRMAGEWFRFDLQMLDVEPPQENPEPSNELGHAFAGDAFWWSQDGSAKLADGLHKIGVQGFRVLCILLCSLEDNNVIHISQAEIAVRLAMKRSNVSSSIGRLVDFGIIRPGPRVGHQPTYSLDPYYGWKGSNANYRKAMKAAKLTVVT
jgi:hypothetical protein